MRHIGSTYTVELTWSEVRLIRQALETVINTAESDDHSYETQVLLEAWEANL